MESSRGLQSERHSFGGRSSRFVPAQHKPSKSSGSTDSLRIISSATPLERARQYYGKLHQNQIERNAINKEKLDILKSLIDGEKHLQKRIKKLQTELQDTTRMKEKLINNPGGDRDVCVICGEQEREYLCFPCGHFAICTSCKDELDVCPVPSCNNRIIEKIKVFFP